MELLQAPQEEGPSPGEIVLAPDKEESACVEFLQALQRCSHTLAGLCCPRIRRSPPVWSSCRPPKRKGEPLLRLRWPFMRRSPPVCGLPADSLEEGQHS